MLEDVPTERHLTSHQVDTQRVKIPSGWLVITIASKAGAGIALAHTVIHDPNHEWKFEKKESK